MREVFFCESIEEEILAIIKHKYPYGIVGVIGASDTFLQQLKQQQNPYIEIDRDELPTSVRYVVGFGNNENIMCAKRFALDKIVMLCPPKLNMEILSNSCIVDNNYMLIGHPNYIFLDVELLEVYTYDLMKVMSEVYIASLDIMASEIVVSAVIVGIMQDSIKFILSEHKDIKSLQAAIHIAMRLWDYETVSAITVCSLIKQNNSNKKENAGIIFIIYLLAQFTKYKINGILYGADRVRIRQMCNMSCDSCRQFKQIEHPPNYDILQRFLPTGDLLWSIKESVGWHKGLLHSINSSCIQTIDNLLIATEITETSGSITYFAYSGLLEGVRNENYS